MKKIKIFILIICALTLTGCVKFNANMEIKKDKSMNFSMTYAFDKSLTNGQEIFTKEKLKEIEDSGFKVTKYQEGNMEGFTASASVKNIDKVSTTKDEKLDLSGIMNNDEKDKKYIFKIEKGLFKNTYKTKINFNTNEQPNQNMDNENLFPNDDTTLENNPTEDYSELYNNMDIASMMTNMELKFNTILPYSALSNNATKTSNENKELEWDLTKSTSDIEFEFELYNWPIIYITIGIGIISIIVIIVIILACKNTKLGNQSIEQQPTNENKTQQAQTVSNVEQPNINQQNIINNPATNNQNITNNQAINQQNLINNHTLNQQPLVQEPNNQSNNGLNQINQSAIQETNINQSNTLTENEFVKNPIQTNSQNNNLQ